MQAAVHLDMFSYLQNRITYINFYQMEIDYKYLYKIILIIMQMLTPVISSTPVLKIRNCFNTH